MFGRNVLLQGTRGISENDGRLMRKQGYSLARTEAKPLRSVELNFPSSGVFYLSGQERDQTRAQAKARGPINLSESTITSSSSSHLPQMPVLSSSKKLKKKSSLVSLADLDDGAKLPWLTRTDITSALRQISKKTWEITMSDLNPVMAKVVRTAVEVGAIALQLGPYNLKLADEHTKNNASNGSDSDSQSKDEWGERVHVVKYTPFQPHGLNEYGVDALIKAAEILRFDGEYDVAHRLEVGSMALYIRPLSNYVRIISILPPVADHPGRLPVVCARIAATSRLRRYSAYLARCVSPTAPTRPVNVRMKSLPCYSGM